MSVTTQLQEIQRTLGEHTGTLKSIEKNGDKTHRSISELWKSQSAQDNKITRLETKAGVIGAIAGVTVAAVIGIARWVFG